MRSVWKDFNAYIDIAKPVVESKVFCIFMCILLHNYFIDI
ncbi:hypothetical protein yaldo0001_36460 [Yersinia aldovae ATCC 35236]|nr:hypothetical protein yaldo0001_36460 [Yersinia aldovae ATCC 35236]